MPTSRTWLVGTALVLAIGLAGATAGVVHYRAQATASQARLSQVQETVNALKRQLDLRQPLAPDVVLKYTPVETESSAVTAPAVAPEAATDQVVALQARITELERALQARGSTTNRPSVENWRTRSMTENLEALKQSDPERYAAFIQQREALRRSVDDAIARQAVQLMEADASGLAEDERQQRTQMLQLVNDTWQLSRQILAVPPPENRRELMRTAHENLETLGPMFEVERNRQFRQLALESGYSERDAGLFVDYVNDVIDATSTQPLRRSMRRGGWGGGGPPPAAAAQPSPR